MNMIRNFYLFLCNKTHLNYPKLLNRIFNKSNINKVIIIFIIGLATRILINYLYSINVYSEYLNTVSLIYYIFFSLLIVFIHEVVTYFDINIIPYFILNPTEVIFKIFNSLVKIINFIGSYPLKLYYLIEIKTISVRNISMVDLKLSSVINIFKELFNNKNYVKLYGINYNDKSLNNIKVVQPKSDSLFKAENIEISKAPEIPIVFNKGSGSNYNSNNSNGLNYTNNVQYSPSVYSTNSQGNVNNNQGNVK